VRVASGQLVLALWGLSSALGCSDGGRGDSVPSRLADIAGDGERLAKLNDPANPRPPEGRDLSVTGVTVIAVDGYDETRDGSSSGNLYAQDLDGTPAPYSGITVFGPSFSPPALRVAPGDVVDAFGRYVEFPGPSSSPFNPGETLPELVGPTLSLRFEGDLPAPLVIDVKELANYATGRRYIGMLVRVEGVTLSDDPFTSSSGRYSVSFDVGPGVELRAIPKLSNALFDLAASGKPLARGARFASITGVVQYFYNFSIAPRSAEDLAQ
jgi:hypothetical protein